MDIFDEEILNFWKALQEHDVKYIIVGGFGIKLYVYQNHKYSILWFIFLRFLLKLKVYAIPTGHSTC